VLLIAGVLLLFYPTCVSAEVTQHLVVEEASSRSLLFLARRRRSFSASAEKTLKAQEAALQPTKPPTEAPTKAPTKPPTPFDWTQCKSEGGLKNCAKCKGGDDNAFLPCDTVPSTTNALGPSPKVPSIDCPDDKLWKGSYFQGWHSPQGRGTGTCRDSIPCGQSASTESTYDFPGGIYNSSADKLDRNLVATKAFVTHPTGASENVGVVMFKRMVMHQCTGTKPDVCKKGDKVADVFKQGYCVNCKSKKYSEHSMYLRYADCGDNCTVFRTPFAKHATKDHKKAFAGECFTEAFTPEGTMKEDYQCSKEDMLYASANIAMF